MTGQDLQRHKKIFRVYSLIYPVVLFFAKLDVVLRRTDLGMTGQPGHAELIACADVMSKELNWSEATIQQELEEVNKLFKIKR